MEKDNAQTTTEKTFTQEELNSIVQKRIGEVNAKYANYEELKAKAEKFDSMDTEELQKANERVDALQNELNAMKQAESVRVIREEVSKSFGVPANLLTADTKEDCEAQAKNIVAFAKPKAYPRVKDGGEVGKVAAGTTREQFANWFGEMTKER